MTDVEFLTCQVGRGPQELSYDLRQSQEVRVGKPRVAE